MRIAISGTHQIGKTTLINDFVKSHPEYEFKPEPYHILQDEHGIEFSQDPTMDCLLTQLDFSIDLLNKSGNSKNIIFDRCPVDFIAYAMYITDEEHTYVNDSIIAEKFPAIKEALENLDLIVFLPITKSYEMDDVHHEDIEYRQAIDRNFRKLYFDEVCDIFPGYQQPKIIELYGNRNDRIKKLEAYLK